MINIYQTFGIKLFSLMFSQLFPLCYQLVAAGFFVSLFGAVPIVASPTSDKPEIYAIYRDASKPVKSRVNDLLSRMSFLEQLAQTRNVGGILGENASFDSTAVYSFNNGLGGGSICKL